MAVVDGRLKVSHSRCVHHPPGGDCTAGVGHVRRGGLFAAGSGTIVLVVVGLPLLYGVAVASWTRGVVQAAAEGRLNEWLRPFDIAVGYLAAVLVVVLVVVLVRRWWREREASTCP